MGAIAYALSVSHFINSVGAKAGFAAIVGLALVVLLFFAQMRETASLRERAQASDEHVAQLEQRLAQLSRGVAAVVPAPAGVNRAGVVPAPAGVRAAALSAPGASRTVGVPYPVGAAPAAPAGVGAPALASATRHVPAGAPDAISIRATGATAPPAHQDGVPAGVAAAAAGAAGAAASAGGTAAPPAGPRPATAAGGANGASTSRPPMPAPAPPPPPAAARPAAPSRRQQPARTAAPRPPVSAPRRSATAAEPSRIRTAAMIVAGIVAVAVLVVVLLNATGGSSSTNNSSSQSGNSSAARSHKHRAVALTPALVTVAVLNGTTTTNLAHDTGQRLSAVGYKLGTIATATDQSVSATVVGYRGRANRPAALLVARSLKLGPASVQPVSQSDLAVACPTTSTCSAQVIVTIGADLASAAGASTSAAST